MNSFSSDYLYIFKNSFKDDFWWALFHSSISIFFLLIAIISLAGLVFLIISLKSLPKDHYGYGAARGMAILMVVLIPTIIGCSLLSILSLPEMRYVTFQKEHVDKIYEIYYKNTIDLYKDYPILTAQHLENGVVHHGDSWATNSKYKELEKNIYTKIPDAENKVIYNPYVYKILNKLFLQCFDNGFIPKLEKPASIDEMVNIIGLNDEKCLNQASEEFINIINELHLSK